MDPVPGTTRQRRSFRVMALVLGLSLVLLAVVSVVGVLGLDGGERIEHRVHDLASFIQLGLLLAVPLILQARAPERRIALMQLSVLTMVAFGVAYTLSGAAWALGGLLLSGVLIWLHPARGALLTRGRFSVPLAVLVVAGAVLLVGYALEQAAVQDETARVLIFDPDYHRHWEEFHWASMAALALGLPLAGIAAVLGSTGWRIAAWLVGLAAVVFGAGFVAFPDRASSLGGPAGLVAVVGGVLFVLVAEWEARRRPSVVTPAEPR